MPAAPFAMEGGGGGGQLDKLKGGRLARESAAVLRTGVCGVWRVLHDGGIKARTHVALSSTLVGVVPTGTLVVCDKRDGDTERLFRDLGSRLARHAARAIALAARSRHRTAAFAALCTVFAAFAVF